MKPVFEDEFILAAWSLIPGMDTSKAMQALAHILSTRGIPYWRADV